MNRTSGFTMFMIILVAVACVALGVIFSLAHAQEANITRYDSDKYTYYVYDGDTFYVKQDGAIINKIRLWGYDSPEMRDSYGEKAKQALASLVDKQGIIVCEAKGKSYDRTVMKCNVGGDTGAIDVGEFMVRNGHGQAIWKYTHGTTYGKKLQRLMREAQDAGRGMWEEY